MALVLRLSLRYNSFVEAETMRRVVQQFDAKS